MSNSRRVLSWRRRQKDKVVIYLGGSCCVCGYNTCNRSLDVHHVDPTKKEFGIGAGGVTRAWSKVLVELDKCVLLCKNCHGEVHSGLIEMSILSEILRKDLLVRRRRAETIIKNSDLTRTVSEPRECDCGKIVSKGATRCMDCYRRTMQTKIDWPPVDELLSMIESTSYAETGRKLGVSDNAVRKRLKRSMG